MKNTRGVRWKVLGVCFSAAVAWEYLYLEASMRLDPEHRFDFWLAEAPRWVRRLHLWTPGLVAARILNAFGLRFDMQQYDDNTPFILASTALTWTIWTAILYGATVLVRRWRQRVDHLAAA